MDRTGLMQRRLEKELLGLERQTWQVWTLATPYPKVSQPAPHMLSSCSLLTQVCNWVQLRNAVESLVDYEVNKRTQ